MGKGKRLKKSRRLQARGLDNKFAELMTKNFQKELRSSEIWDQMVAEYGEEKAEQYLKEIKAQVGPGEKR
jgi:hypothetical protein